MVKTYGDVPFLLVPPNSSNPAPFTYSSSNTNVATINGNVVTITGKGITTITATQAPSGSYTGGTVTATLTVNPAVPALSMDAINKVEGDQPFALALSNKSPSTGLITYSSSNPSIATINGNQVTINAPGTVIITATQAAAGNYAEGKTTTTLTIERKLIVKWDLPSTLNSGSTVTSASTATIPGVFSYSPAVVSYYTATGAAPTQKITATFTPTSKNQSAISQTWSVTVVPQTKTFTFNGKDQTWTTPKGIQYIQIDAKGAGGGRGGFDESAVGQGGEGGHVIGIIPVNPAETLSVVVGQGGAGGATEASGGGSGSGGNVNASGYTYQFHGGNGGNAGNSGVSGAGGGGGGASAVLRGQTELVVAAGGGGGNGGARWNGSCNFAANAVGANLIASGYAGDDGQTNSGDGGGGGGGGGGHRGGQGGAFVYDWNETACTQTTRASGGGNYLLGNTVLNATSGGGIGGGTATTIEGDHGSIVITY